MTWESVALRGTGRTTPAQMKAAPKDAYFVWCTPQLDYPKMLAKELGRSDLKVIRPYDLERDRMRGLQISGMVVDHAARLPEEQEDLAWKLCMMRQK